MVSACPSPRQVLEQYREANSDKSPGKSALLALLEFLTRRQGLPEPSSPVPVLLLDLDSTLFHSDARHLQILSDYIDHHHPGDEKLLQALEELHAAGHIWNPAENLVAAGIQDEALLRHFFAYWRERYFGNDYLCHDVPVPGAPEYVRACHALGGFCFYLTGRVDSLMREGTRESLFQNGFPMDHRTRLHMKPALTDRDLEFKRSAIEALRAAGEVVGIFENEPANVNLFHETFPEAIPVFLKTIHSPKAPQVLPHIPQVTHFLLEEV